MPIKVLFLDDEPELCELFKDYFEGDGVEIFTFTSKDEAIRFSHKENLNLIFLDFRLPGITGDKVAQMMPASVPKYLITGEIQLESSYAFKEIITKPLNTKKIEEIIKSHKG